MYYLTNFHRDYPEANVIFANCGETISLSCPNESENNSSTIVRSKNNTRINVLKLFFFVLQFPTMWFRLYENAYPQPLILGDRQLIDDQRFMLRTQNTGERHLEIIGVRKDDEGYYLCKSGNEIQSSYNLTIRSTRLLSIR